MSDEKHDGGPCPEVFYGPVSSIGRPAEPEVLSLRDFFAAAALQGLLALPEDPEVRYLKCGPVKHLSKRAYEYADAMLQERQS
jgi:hypothetical protein